MFLEPSCGSWCAQLPGTHPWWHRPPPLRKPRAMPDLRRCVDSVLVDTHDNFLICGLIWPLSREMGFGVVRWRAGEVKEQLTSDIKYGDQPKLIAVLLGGSVLLT